MYFSFAWICVSAALELFLLFQKYFFFLDQKDKSQKESLILGCEGRILSERKEEQVWTKIVFGKKLNWFSSWPSLVHLTMCWFSSFKCDEVKLIEISHLYLSMCVCMCISIYFAYCVHVYFFICVICVHLHLYIYDLCVQLYIRICIFVWIVYLYICVQDCALCRGLLI